MKPLGISPKAAEDLEEIVHYIARDNPARARSFADELVGVCKKIPEMPDGYAARPELGRGIRVALHGRYMIFFRVFAHEVRIERILHGARDLVRAIKG